MSLKSKSISSKNSLNEDERLKKISPLRVLLNRPELGAPNSGLFNKTLSGDIFFRRSSSLRLFFDEILFDFNDI